MAMILELLGSAGFGTLLGGVFAYLGKREERAAMQMKFDHEKGMIEAQTNASIQMAKMSIEEAEVLGKLTVEKEESKAFSVSQKSSGIGESVKAFIRPVILFILMYQTYLIFKSLKELTGGLVSLPEADIVGLYKIVILMITGLTATAVSWYFAQRSSKQFDKLVEQMGIK
jgi:hypothetical protein